MQILSLVFLSFPLSPLPLLCQSTFKNREEVVDASLFFFFLIPQYSEKFNFHTRYWKRGCSGRRLICRAINWIFRDGQAAKIGQWKMHYICFIYRAVRSIYFAYIEKPERFVRACRSTKRRRPFARLRVQHGVMNFSTTRVAFSTRRVDNVRSNVSILPLSSSDPRHL